MAQSGKAVGVATAAAIAGGSGVALKTIEHAAMYRAVTHGAEYEASNGALHGAEYGLPRVAPGNAPLFEDVKSDFNSMLPNTNDVSQLPPHITPLNRPIILPPGALSEMVRQRKDPGAIADALASWARPQIIQGLKSYGDTLTYRQAYHVVDISLENAAGSAATENKSLVKFEALSGKLSVDAPVRIGKMEVSLGDINVYKVAGIATAGVMACKGLRETRFDACVSKALSRVGNALVNHKTDEAEAKNTE